MTTDDAPRGHADLAARTAAEVLDHHLGAFAEGVDAVLSDYTPDAVLITPEATYHGATAIWRFFDQFIARGTPAFWSAFTIERREVVGDVAYITWSAHPAVTLATDTFVVVAGKIVVQTYTPLA
ncbi:nuclear transport factor 2 family protein [Lichenicoccus roseus]|uniref:Nuclear transport factor 2 family protein n=1 Tax=Lichenicoccus roseus TaxID=2683649 RepID=A0A5R9J8Q8_9PROT|nr:nuclear transport factor 2 family protein [Lichenicoccus roseus]TLU74000.1 nuclear transport factor 2 family protein [Lichenicoccus roseus]